MNTSVLLYEKARDRVMAVPELAKFHDFIFADWPEGNDHFRWLLQATDDEILSWAEAGQ